MTLNKFIREGRRRLGMSEQRFANALGVTRGAVQQWERQDGTAPKRANQPRVAQLLGVSVAELIAGTSAASAGAGACTEVPVISAADAGNYTAVDNFSPNGQFDMVRVTVPVQRHTYALCVHGDSMVSKLGDSVPEGSFIIVEPEMKAQAGDYVVALRDGNQSTFKQLVSDGGDLYLKPLNARYPLKPLGNHVIVGVVREFTKQFR